MAAVNHSDDVSCELYEGNEKKHDLPITKMTSYIIPQKDQKKASHQQSRSQYEHTVRAH